MLAPQCGYSHVLCMLKACWRPHDGLLLLLRMMLPLLLLGMVLPLLPIGMVLPLRRLLRLL